MRAAMSARHPRGLALARLDGVQGLGLQLLVRGVLRRRSRRPARRGPSSSSRSGPRDGRHLRQRLPLQVLEAHHHVRHLHARVVDVVLDAHLVPAVPQHAHEGVAEDRVAQVADVGGLVGIDARVLDDRAAGYARGGRPRPRRCVVDLAGQGAAVEEEVHVAAARDLGLASRAATSRARRPGPPRSRAACAAASSPGRRAR